MLGYYCGYTTTNIPRLSDQSDCRKLMDYHSLHMLGSAEQSWNTEEGGREGGRERAIKEGEGVKGCVSEVCVSGCGHCGVGVVDSL